MLIIDPDLGQPLFEGLCYAVVVISFLCIVGVASAALVLPVYMRIYQLALSAGHIIFLHAVETLCPPLNFGDIFA